MLQELTKTKVGETEKVFYTATQKEKDKFLHDFLYTFSSSL